jgi:putative membrane-bound dehydrogenase-like protein
MGALLVLVSFLPAFAQQEPTLRVFIRGGVKTHGPGQHDHPRFLGEWTKLLTERGAKVDGAMEFPTRQQLENTDVIVIYAADGMKVVGEQRADFEKFLKRGGGLVVIHDGVVSGDQHEWAKKVQGGAWRWDGDKKTKWLETEVGMYFVNPQHPIVNGVSNFDWKDEIYYDLDMAPDVKVLATSFHSVFIIAPQLWTYEKTWEGGSAPYRAFVSLPGHEYTSFQTPHYRAILLRGIAWAGKRKNVDSLCSKEELASLTYPAGGPTAPEKAAEKMNVHSDFTVSLVASEPLVEKVISLDWDPKGRLWVAETPEYPGGRTLNKNDQMVALWGVNEPEKVVPGAKEDRPARDRISWLEDTNGDGRMDQKHVFADFEHGVPGGLELVTSLVFYKDGVIVSQAPDILWIRDTNGDGTADKVEKLYTGFGNFDTHAVINNFRWGLDGWIYSAIGYSAGEPTSGDGSRKFGRVTAGIIRFRPDGSALEQYASGSCNTWGFDFAPDGEAFYTTATCGEHFLHVVMPEKVLARGNVGGVRASSILPDHQKIFPAVNHTRPAYVQIDWVGMFTAAAGCCLYNGGVWPEKWNGQHFCSETTMSLVHNDFLKPSGVSYIASKEPGREESEFIAGSDLWFRPIHTRVGPDGALYVVDFYNQAAIHNDTRGPAHGARNAATRPDRDHHFARIWRVQHRQAKTILAPKLDQFEGGPLIAQLAHPNGWVRDTAARLLREKGVGDKAVPLKAMVKAANLGITAQLAALYTAEALGELDNELLVAAVSDRDPVVRKNALRIVADRDNSGSVPDVALVAARINDADPRTRLNALIALGTFDLTPELAQAVVTAWPSYNDKHTQSAAVGVAAKDPAMFLTAAFNAKDPAFLADFVAHVTRALANKQDAAQAAKVVAVIAKQPAATDGLKQSVLETLAMTLKPEVAPPWNAELQSAFSAILTSSRPGLPGAALPLIARWDSNGALAADLKPVITQLSAKLQDASLPEDQRGQVAVNLLGVRKMDASVVPNVAALLGSSASPALQKRAAEALGDTGDSAAGAALITAFPKLDTELREVVFGQLVKRGDWANLLVQALTDKKIDTFALGPANLHRLRTHADKGVAAKANEVIDALKGPEQKQKDELIATFKPVVEQPGGNLANGKKLYLDNCAACHRFKNDGADFAPNLTGMGAHGPADLLLHILDPNRLVEPNFVSVNIETRDELSYDGIVLRENPATVVLRNQTGEFEIRKDNIKSRNSTGRSLMPEGFEALGAEGVRDLLAYICADDLRFRILDLTPAFTADTRQGIYNSKESREETLRFKKFGTIKFGDVPFDIVSPQKSPTGNNVIVLKGGSGIARGYPQKVEVKVGVPVSQLHILGLVGGWAWPFDGEKNKGLDAAKITVHFAGGGTEEIVLKNGVEFADYIASIEVPGSKEVPDLCHNGRQIRYVAKVVKSGGVVEKLSIESFNNVIAPTFVGITAELAGDPTAPSSVRPPVTAGAAAPAPSGKGQGEGAAPASKIKVLIVGGGSSHDFDRWFNQEDSKTLEALGNVSVKYTDKPAEILPALKDLDVLYLSHNQPMADPEVRKAIFAFADAGKGLLLVHPALWYNWNDWPEYNRVLVGGGSKSHDKYGEFQVHVNIPQHPIMTGVPDSFKISDELYHHQPDKDGAAVQVLAFGKNPTDGKTYPAIWVTKHPKARIVCITLGHDGKAHEHPAFKTILQNSLKWAAGK